MTIRITLNPEVPATPLADEIVFWAAEALEEIEASTASGSLDEVLDARDQARNVLIAILLHLEYRIDYTEED